MINLYRKIIRFDCLHIWREFVGLTQNQVVATNGCFDVIHRGHVEYLHRAKKLGDILIVGVNNDQAVRQLKGEARPVNVQEDRAFVLAGLSSVDVVVVFDGTTAASFLDIVRPDVWVKGGDYTPDTLDQTEVKIVHQHSGSIQIIPLVPGHSTTNILSR